ncbi:hypothetical protein TPHA_0I00350 [Tetrapisispora phaffii CBS 4417]|uniref:RNB domain-containing protein n=1 Tax=Tetrapisispora phaffii (strain ATCC 24235 / CBS 4417 / NBRC 1672 / NRRL Y-8282 / UCD 70-5) TaxID=1071381 RepID=G8BXB4_TETPH|nr:hypothetical protein TPHA_0I00350 [Tetrapisispora phaffii CBS 4417]CCE64542.1 hypothetical protein TPHA_0I00350 [Tetrapisispora phaffii CBS 4417]
MTVHLIRRNIQSSASALKLATRRTKYLEKRLPASFNLELVKSKFLERTKGLEHISEIKEVDEIQNQSMMTFNNEYIVPSKVWFDTVTSSGSFSNDLINETLISKKWKKFPDLPIKMNGDYSFNALQLFDRSLDIGDLVLLRNSDKELLMCVDIPMSIEDPRFTFAKPDGTLVFSTKQNVTLRILNTLPKNILNHDLIKNKYEAGLINRKENNAIKLPSLPVVARQIATSPLPSEISRIAARDLNVNLKKLEVLHRYISDGVETSSISFLKLVHLVQNVDLNKLARNRADHDANHISNIIRNTKDDIQYMTKIDAITLLSTYWAVIQQQQSQLWGDIQIHSALLFPISVSVLPFNNVIYLNETIPRVATDENINKFTEAINKHNLEKINEKFPDFLNMLKEYGNGCYYGNEKITTIISKLFRRIETYKNKELSRDNCQKLYNELNPSNKILNSLLLSKDLCLPEISGTTRTEQLIYSLTEVDNHAIIDQRRHDFKDLKVFCIDEKTAHEIDDGVSVLRKDGNITRLFIHIADPASLFPLHNTIENNSTSDEILNIAFRRAFTTYLPEFVLPMLPKSFCTKSDLGNTGKMTNTITFSVDFDKSSCSILEDTFEIQLGKVNNFPKNTTYKEVDKILNSSIKRENDIERDLREMRFIANHLRKCRIDNSAVIFGEGFNKGAVNLIEKKQDGEKSYKVNFKDSETTPSNIIVSEFMILANSLAGKYFKNHKIPAIYKTYKGLNMKPKASSQFKKILNVNKKRLPSIKEISKIGSLLSSSTFSSKPSIHEMIGTDQYATVTSPLRRFPDLINHFQLHRYLTNQPLCFSQEKLDEMVWHLIERDTILRHYSRKFNKYWTLQYLNEKIEGNPLLRFDVMVQSVSENGRVHCILPKLSYATGTLKLKPSATTIPAIGEIIKNCKIANIDCLGNSLEFAIDENQEHDRVNTFT